jgi:hypothetical protein
VFQRFGLPRASIPDESYERMLKLGFLETICVATPLLRKESPPHVGVAGIDAVFDQQPLDIVSRPHFREEAVAD